MIKSLMSFSGGQKQEAMSILSPLEVDPVCVQYFCSLVFAYINLIVYSVYSLMQLDNHEQSNLNHVAKI